MALFRTHSLFAGETFYVIDNIFPAIFFMHYDYSPDTVPGTSKQFLTQFLLMNVQDPSTISAMPETIIRIFNEI